MLTSYVDMRRLVAGLARRVGAHEGTGAKATAEPITTAATAERSMVTCIVTVDES